MLSLAYASLRMESELAAYEADPFRSSGGTARSGCWLDPRDFAFANDQSQIRNPNSQIETPLAVLTCGVTRQSKIQNPKCRNGLFDKKCKCYISSRRRELPRLISIYAESKTTSKAARESQSVGHRA